MTQDKRAEIVEAMARKMADLMIRDDQRFNTKEYASAALDVALKAAAEVAQKETTTMEALAGKAHDDDERRDRLKARGLTALRIRDNLLALTSEGVKE